MSWEEVDALPGTRAGGAFRSGSEPVVAERLGLSGRERLRLYWRTTPELPAARAAEWVAVTPHHVYVQRRDKSRARMRLDQLQGERLERGLLVYGVPDDEDLLLAYRPSCEVQDVLAGAIRGTTSIAPWRVTRGVIATLIFTALFLGGGVVALMSYPVDGALEHIGRGFYTSERVLGTLGGFAALLAGVALFALAPSRWRVDAVGVTHTRGVFPWLPFTLPAERCRRAVIRPAYFRPKGSRMRHHAGYWVDLGLHAPARVGRTFRTPQIQLEWFTFGQGKRTPEIREKVAADAHALADRLRSLLSLEETEVKPIRP